MNLFRPLQLGSIRIDWPVFLAPMAGYTDRAMRGLCREYGCGAVYTEVVNAAAIVRGSVRTRVMLENDAAERPSSAHLYGADPVVMGEAAAIVEGMGRYDWIDINCGCPVRKIVIKGAGAALMRDPERVAEIVSCVRRSVHMPVTVKTRIGFAREKVDVPAVAEAAETAGAAAVAIHGRFAVDRHGGQSNWDILGRVKSERGIPVIGNGGIDRPEDAQAMLRSTGVDAVMVGRAAIGAPWFFRQVVQDAQGERVEMPTMTERADTIYRHVERLLNQTRAEAVCLRRPEGWAERSAVLRFRGHLVKYLQGLRGWASVRRSLSSMDSIEKLRVAVEHVIKAESGKGSSVR